MAKKIIYILILMMAIMIKANLPEKGYGSSKVEGAHTIETKAFLGINLQMNTKGHEIGYHKKYIQQRAQILRKKCNKLHSKSRSASNLLLKKGWHFLISDSLQSTRINILAEGDQSIIGLKLIKLGRNKRNISKKETKLNKLGKIFNNKKMKDATLNLLLTILVLLCVFENRIKKTKWIIFFVMIPTVVCVNIISYSENSFTFPYDVVVDPDGHYFVIGEIMIPGNIKPFGMIMKINSQDGSVLCTWRSSNPNTVHLVEAAEYIGGLIISGVHDMSVQSWRFGFNCAFIWEVSYSPQIGNNAICYSVAIVDTTYFTLGCKSDDKGTLIIAYISSGAVYRYYIDSSSRGYVDMAVSNGYLTTVADYNADGFMQSRYQAYTLSGVKQCSVIYSADVYNQVLPLRMILLKDGYQMIFNIKGGKTFVFYKINDLGELSWEKSINSEYSLMPKHMETFSIGYIVITAMRYIDTNNNYHGYTAILTTNNLTLIWETYDSPSDCAYWVCDSTADNGIVVAGYNNYATNGFRVLTYNPINCSAGNYGNFDSYPLSCAPCPVGTFMSHSGASKCDNCSAGTYQELTGKTSCNSCLAGSSSITGQSSCFPCPVGTSQSSPGSPSCDNCPAGYYQNVTGSLNCVICPAGTYQSQTGQSVCTECGQGFYGTLTGQTSNTCQACAIGHYNSQTGKISCLPCEIGYYASSTGSSSCTPAAAGFYVASTAQSSPQPCATGTFQNQTAQTSCIGCSPGFYQDSTGQSSSKSCSAGSFTDGSSKIICTQCSPGYFQSQIQQTSCTPCIESQYSSSSGATSCSNCAVGWYPSVTRDKCLYKGIFNSASDFTSSNLSTLCFSSGTIVKPFSLDCRSAFVPLCCNGKTSKTTINCNFGLELQSSDILYNRYCNPCAFTNVSACPPDSICWNDITDSLNTNFSLSCLEFIAPYCGSRLILNPNDTECLVFTNSCNSVVVNSSYGTEYTKFKITFSRALPTTIPACNTIFDLTKTPLLNSGAFTCTRTSDYTIGVDISQLSSPISSFYLANSMLKDACRVNVPSNSVINILPPDNKEILQITGTTIDKCMGLVINSTITKSYLWPILAQTWSVSYVDTSGIPNENLQRLNALGNSNKTTITISDYDLFPGKVLSVSSAITTQYGTTVNSNIILLTVPNIGSGKAYCGPCQLSTRSNCQKYNGICWTNYLNYFVTEPLNTSLCLKAIARECYNIWISTSIDDPQCLYFKPYYNLTNMKIRPSLENAKYSASGKTITLTFSHPIYTGDFTDCGSLFSSNTVNWLPQSKSGTWIDSTTLQVDYDPQIGIMKQMTLKGGILHYDYAYAQEFVNNNTISITLPVLDATLKINGLTKATECDSIELFGVPATPSLHKLTFKWEISYNTSALSSSILEELNQHLSKFSTFNPQGVFNLPSQFLVRGTTIKVTLTAKAEAFDSNLLTTTTEVYVMDDTPKITFMSKSASVLELDGSKNSSIQIEIFNFRCAKASATSESDIIPVDVEFQVLSGTTAQDISIQGESESKLAQALNNLFSTYKRLMLGANLGFTYLKFYNITAIIRDRLTGNKNSDNLVVYFTKPPIKCVIDQIGSLVNLFRDIELNGGNSVIPIPVGDTIEYKWKCLSSTILDYSGSCSCPIMDDSDMMNSKLIIPKDRMKDMCRYIFSLIVIATQGTFKRSSRNETQFITFKGPIAPLQGVILKGTHNTIKDLYFTFALPQSDTSIKDSDLAIKWSLVEVKSQMGTSTTQYSMINTFIYDFFTSDLKLNLDPSIKFRDAPVPENLTPKLLTSNLTRVLGVDQASLLPQYIYTFGAVVYYPSAPSIVFVDFFTPNTPRKRDLTITPTSGVGFETSFRISFFLSSSTDIDGAHYQIFRKNCPSSANETTTALTPLFGRSNNYVLELAPGLKSCNYQVEITVRAFEYDDFIDMSAIIIVTTPSKPAINIITSQLNKMMNSDMLTVDQRISILAEISNVNVTEQTSQGQNLTNLIISELSKIDMSKGGIMDIMEPKDKVILLSTQSSIMASLSIKQAPNIDMKLASTMKSKINDYLIEVKTIEGGSYIIQSSLAALSGIVDIATNKQFETEFFASMQTTMQTIIEMKQKEMPPGAPVQTLASPAIDLVLNKNYISVFDQKQTYSTPKNVSVDLPEGLQKQMIKSLDLNTQGRIVAVNASNPQAVASSIEKRKSKDILKATLSSNVNRTVTIGTSIKATSFNPFETIKSNAAVNKNFINNASSSFVRPEMIANLYVDIAKGRMNTALNPKEQTTNIMQLGFTPFEFQKNATETSINAGVGIGALSEEKKAYFTFPPFGSVAEYVNSSVIVPLYYLADINKWINENCSLVEPKPEDAVLKLTCSKIGTKVIQNIHQAFSLTVDVIKDVLKVIAAGNYMQLINVSSFLQTGTRNIVAYACILVIILGFVFVELTLYKKDKHDIYVLKCKVLHERYNRVEVIVKYGTLYEIMEFFCKIKKQGFSKSAKRDDQTVHVAKDKSLKKKKKRQIIKDNGLTILSREEEEELRDLYDLFLQVSGIYEEEEMEAIMAIEIESSNVLHRLTKVRIDEEILKQSVTFCTLLRSEHPVISAFAKPEITTPRMNKFLILTCVIVGELFVTGYFYNTDSTKDPSTELSENSSSYLGSTVIYSIAATLLMIPMKIFISLFLIGSFVHEDMSREQIEDIERKSSVYLSIGFVAGIAWLGGCLYGILMYILNFPEDAIKCWMTTYVVSFFNETCLIIQLKILFKVIVGLVVLRLAKSRILLTFVGVCVGKIVDKLVSLI